MKAYEPKEGMKVRVRVDELMLREYSLKRKMEFEAWMEEVTWTSERRVNPFAMTENTAEFRS